ncbi:MAG: hypothetical protein KH452_11625, partial [Clostridiales bacterium]|nr:hypothetical protein [Clostridiales bacterium]
LPVITLVLYVGETPWDGAENLREMVDMYRIPETISDDTYIALADYTGEPGLLKIMEEVKKEGGGLDMCQAIREMVEDGRKEGRRLGEQRLRLLMTYMCDAGESDMIVKVVQDEELLQEMYRKYQIR